MALRREDRDVAALTVLGLLSAGPRHPYEMHRMMIDFHKDFVTGMPRAMYHAVEKLQRAGGVEVVGTSSEGGRPERTVYGLTDSGRARLAEQVARMLETPDPDATVFVAALSFVGCLTADAARAALTVRRDVLAAQLDEAERGVAAAAEHVPRLLLVEGEFAISRLRAEHAWVAALVADLASGALPWPDRADLTALAEVPHRSC